MEHADLIDALEVRLGSRRGARDAVDAFTGAIVAEVASGGRVALSGFGVFDSAGSGTGGRVPRFRPGAAFREIVEAGPGALPADGQAQSAGHQRVQDVPRQRNRASGKAVCESVPVQVLTFARFELPPGTSLSAVLPELADRCGIYVLHFDDGHRYVGQARDVLVRFSHHRRRWGDRIVAFEFGAVSPAALNDLERRTIQRLECQGVGLYNSALVGLPMGESPLDLVVDRVEQERWLDAGAETAYDLQERLDVAACRSRVGKGFAELAVRDDYAAIRAALFLYLVDVVPWPHETERRFWSITSMPSTNRSKTHRRLSTVSVNNVETLVLAQSLIDGEWVVGGFVNVSPGMADPHGWPMERHTYRTIGEVDTITFLGPDGLLELLEMPDVVEAARRLAIGLMRKGRGMMAKYHDDSLADDVFSVLAELDTGELTPS